MYIRWKASHSCSTVIKHLVRLLITMCAEPVVLEEMVFKKLKMLECADYFLLLSAKSYKNKRWGFPGGAVVENLPANAGDVGSSPGLGGSHMPRSNWAREPQLLSLRVWSLCSATREAGDRKSVV